jgi:hypothetical protein
MSEDEMRAEEREACAALLDNIATFGAFAGRSHLEKAAAQIRGRGRE